MMEIQRFGNVQKKLRGGGAQCHFSLLGVLYPDPLRVTHGFHPPSPNCDIYIIKRLW